MTMMTKGLALRLAHLESQKQLEYVPHLKTKGTILGLKPQREKSSPFRGAAAVRAFELDVAHACPFIPTFAQVNSAHDLPWASGPRTHTERQTKTRR